MMLDINMYKFRRILIGLLVLLIPTLASYAQAPGYAEIQEPQGGEAIYGLFTIKGSASHPSFVAYQLSFALTEDESETWFLLGEPQTNPVVEGGLGLWDTNGISDGDYRLRLEVFLENNQSIISIVEGVRIRNQRSIETATPAPIIAQVTATSSAPTKTPRPTPLPPLKNEGASLVQGAFITGVILGLVTLSSTGVYLFMRRRTRERLGILRMRQILRGQDRRQTRKSDR